MAAVMRPMEMEITRRFEIDDYLVDPELGRVSLNGGVTSVRPQVMELLVYLARRPGRVVAADELIADLWPGKVVTNASLYNCIAELRRALGGNGDQRSPIETIPKRGYRLAGEVRGLEPVDVGVGRPASGWASAKRRAVVWAPALVLALVAAAYFAVNRVSIDETPTSVQLDDPKPFIAVLPFKDLSPSGNQSYFSEGISEELINTLAQMGDLQVASHSTSFALSEAGLDLPRMRARLNLTHLLEGSVRKDGDRVLITAQLIDVRSDTHLWSSSYERRLDDAFAIQREISEEVVKELKIRVVEPARAVASPEPRALERVLEGRSLVSQRHLESLMRAENLFTQATEIDPGYADAYAGLAKSLVLREGLYEQGDSQLIARAQTALDHALEMDPRNSDALATSGLILQRNDIEAAQRSFQKAIEANPSNSDAYRWLALSYEQTEPSLYLAYMRRAYLVDPLNHPLNFHRVVSLSRFGLYDEALAAVRDWLGLNPQAPGPHAMAGQIHFRQGDLDEALINYYRAYRINPDWRVPATLISEFLTELNQLELAEAWVGEGQGEEISSAVDSRQTMIQQLVLANLRGQEQLGSKLLSQARETDPYWSVDLGRMLALFTEDFGAARAAWERGVSELGWSRLESWGAPNLIDFSLVLQRTGVNERAAELSDSAESLIETQLAAGMVHYGAWESFQGDVQMYSAALHALRGDLQRAKAALANDISKGLTCLRCLKTWPHFDPLRDDPDFEALLKRIENERARQYQGLADRGLLLSPEEVVALEDPNFEPLRLAAEN
jgi:TolB-like protein/DNA-binding winged helix-turn-helix (wHTH) protein/Tfp pilus assembly protein PilF